MSTTSAANISDRTEIIPEKTPLYVGPGVSLHGSIHHDGPTDERAVILGTLKGDVRWNGVVQVPQGGTISATGKIACRELVVAGTISGDGVVIEAGILRLEPTANVQVEEAFLPSGGLEQSRGSFFNGRLHMGSDHPFATNGDEAKSTATSKPLVNNTSVLPAAASFSTTFAADSTEEEESERKQEYAFGNT